GQPATPRCIQTPDHPARTEARSPQRTYRARATPADHGELPASATSESQARRPERGQHTVRAGVGQARERRDGAGDDGAAAAARRAGVSAREALADDGPERAT